MKGPFLNFIQSSIIIVFNIIGIIFCTNNNEILSLMNSNTKWKFHSQEDDIKVYINNNKLLPIIKIEKALSLDYDVIDIFNIILDVSNYNDILSNKNLHSEYLINEQDTLYVYQKTHNYIPFIKNRHLVFKLYKHNNFRLEWKIVDADHLLYHKFNFKRTKKLIIGAGAWEWNKLPNNNLLVHYLYIDPEISVPNFILNNIRKNSAIQVMNDVLSYFHNQGG